MPKHKTLNVHPSLLPKFRGPSPIQSFILSKDEETGITIILMDEEVDHGPILAQQTWTSDVRLDIGCPSYKELEKKLAKLGGKMLVEVIPDWIDGKIKPQKQNHKEATFTKKIIKENGLINPDDSPELIMKKILALTPWPSAYFFAEKDGRKMRIIITDAEIKENKLIIKKIKPEGKKEIPLDNFYRKIIGRYLKTDRG
jgi:methionyl-tRNA formyltransferase